MTKIPSIGDGSESVIVRIRKMRCNAYGFRNAYIPLVQSPEVSLPKFIPSMIAASLRTHCVSFPRTIDCVITIIVFIIFNHGGMISINSNMYVKFLVGYCLCGRLPGH